MKSLPPESRQSNAQKSYEDIPGLLVIPCVFSNGRHQIVLSLAYEKLFKIKTGRFEPFWLI